MKGKIFIFWGHLPNLRGPPCIPGCAVSWLAVRPISDTCSAEAPPNPYRTSHISSRHFVP
jgi:hypothetical protein